MPFVIARWAVAGSSRSVIRLRQVVKRSRRPDPTSRSSRLERANLTLEKLVLSFSGGIFLAIPFLYPGLSLVHFVALVPWLILFLHPRYQAHSAYVLPGSALYMFMCFGPMSAFHIAVPVVLTLINFYAYLLFPLLAKRMWRSGLPLALLTAIAWTLTEWSRPRLSLGHAELFFLGFSQFRTTHLIQIADLTGVYGVCFVVAAASGAVAEFLIPSSGRARVQSVVIAALLMIGTWIYGSFRISDATLKLGPRVAVVQPNEVHYRNREKNRELVEKQIRFTRERIPAGSADLIAWPENAVDDFLNQRGDYQVQLSEMASSMRAHLLVGAYTFIPPDRRHTSAYLFSPDGSMTARYDKMHLILWSEYMPFDHALARWTMLRRLYYRFVQSMLGWTGSGVAGDEMVIFELRGPWGRAGFSSPICFETTTAHLWRDAAAKGSDFLVNITSEGVLGSRMYAHLLSQAAFRAVENRMSVIRAANNGMSAFIDPNGRVQRLLRGVREGAFNGERGTITDTVRLDTRRGTTFYSHHGDVFVLLCAVAAAFILALAALRSTSRSRRLVTEPRITDA